MNPKVRIPTTEGTHAATSAPASITSPGTPPAAAAAKMPSGRELLIRSKVEKGLTFQQAEEVIERQQHYDRTRKPLPRRKV